MADVCYITGLYFNIWPALPGLIWSDSNISKKGNMHMMQLGNVNLSRNPLSLTCGVVYRLVRNCLVALDFFIMVGGEYRRYRSVSISRHSCTGGSAALELEAFA